MNELLPGTLLHRNQQPFDANFCLKNPEKASDIAQSAQLYVVYRRPIAVFRRICRNGKYSGANLGGLCQRILL